ncbi:MAG TPA: amidohydrolase family protein [Marinagarivorans sp.]
MTRHPLRQILSLFLICSLTVCYAEAGVLIENVRPITADAKVGSSTNVYVANGRIRAIGKQLRADKDDTRIDGKGGYLIPGLIDSHVHLQGVPGESEQLTPPLREAALAQIPRSYLYFGFTTVLDLISGDGPIARWNAQPLAPRAYHCAGVPIPGGYPLAWLPKDEQLSSPTAHYYWYDPRQVELMAATPGSDAHKVEPLVARIAETGARCIKTFYETGFGQLRDLPVPSRAMMKALIEVAHKHQLPVYVHGSSREAYDFAMDVGADLLVHGPWHGVDSTQDKMLNELAQRVINSGIGVQPTMQVLYGERELFNPNYFKAARVRAAIPSALQAWYQADAGQWMAKQISRDFGGPDVPNLRSRVNTAYNKPLSGVQAFTRILAERGGDLVFGSDTPSGPMFTQFPGVNGREEMDRWVEQGVSLQQLFIALTARNAKLLGLADELGSVDEGKRADLLILRENPLQSISAYDSIEWVMVKGEPVKRQALAAQ